MSVILQQSQSFVGGENQNTILVTTVVPKEMITCRVLPWEWVWQCRTCCRDSQHISDSYVVFECCTRWCFALEGLQQQHPGHLSKHFQEFVVGGLAYSELEPASPRRLYMLICVFSSGQARGNAAKFRLSALLSHERYRAVTISSSSFAFIRQPSVCQFLL